VAFQKLGVSKMIISTFLLLVIATLATSQSSEDVNVCWRDSYSRGTGVSPNQCGQWFELVGQMCYWECADGYYADGSLCKQKCPDGWADAGDACTVPYDMYFPCPWYDICGLISSCRVTCPDLYKKSGCACKRLSQNIKKDTYVRATTTPICGPSMEEIDKKCFEPCKPSYTGDDLVCWRNDSGRADYAVSCNQFAFGHTDTDCKNLQELMKEVGMAGMECIGEMIISILEGHIVATGACKKSIEEVFPKLINTHRCAPDSARIS